MNGDFKLIKTSKIKEQKGTKTNNNKEEERMWLSGFTKKRPKMSRRKRYDGP